jgi:hypothetical protein
MPHDMGAGINRRVKDFPGFSGAGSGYGSSWLYTRERGESMAIDPRGSLDSARNRAHRAKKSAGRLLVSGVGFAAAYFLDPDHGKARRAQAFQFIDHLRRSRADAKAGEAGRHEPEVPLRTAEAPASRGAFQRAADGVRATSRW